MEIKETTEYSTKQKSFVTVFKITITALLFYWVISQVEVQPLLSNWKNSDKQYLFIAVLIHAVAFLLFSIRWWFLYYIQDTSCKFSNVFGSYYLGLFCNNFLPTGIGGDVIRIIRLRNAGFNTHILVSSTLLDRILGLVSILLMGLVAVTFTPNLHLSIEKKAIFILIAIGLAIGLRILFSDYIARIAERFHERFDHIKIFHFIYTVISTLHEYRKARTQVLLTLCISFAAQYLIIICYLMIGLSLQIQLPVAIYFTIIPIVFVATALPISIGGLGVRESVLISLFVYFQADKQAAIALSLIYFTIIILLSLPGGLVLLSKTKHAVRQKSESSG